MDEYFATDCNTELDSTIEMSDEGNENQNFLLNICFSESDDK